MEKIEKTEAEWKTVLSPRVYEITRRAGTERPFTGEYYNHKDPGTYDCACCGLPLYRSTEKFNAHCGWPSFWDGAVKGNIVEKPDDSLGMRRVEINCARCDAHLGHIFEDGPKPTGMRHCVNSASLVFRKD
ncbi:MAG: peptide-methionine (R)-S-oxide reductase MsrB [Usitatibacter sp.]